MSPSRTSPGASSGSQPERPLEKKLIQADHFRGAKEKLESQLKRIQAKFASPSAPAHSRSPPCERCVRQKDHIREAFLEYYNSPGPDRWYSDSPEYRIAMMKFFMDPSGPNYPDIHALYQKTLRSYLKDTTHPSSEAEEAILADLLLDTKSTTEILKSYQEAKFQSCTEPQASFLRDLSAAKTPQQRAQLHVSYYCTPSPTDSSQLKNLKQKYARLFTDGVPPQEVLDLWRAEAVDSSSKEVASLKSRLAELQMGQSAHLKVQARKKEEREREKREKGRKIVACSKDGCPVDVNVGGSEDIMECVVCDWLERKGEKGRRAYYCSVEHCEEDFEEHENKHHKCIMGERCLYHPEVGPEGTDEEPGAQTCGLCPDCLNHDVRSFFCSSGCYSDNKDIHREKFHSDRRIPNTDAPFEKFEPAADMEIVSPSS